MDYGDKVDDTTRVAFVLRTNQHMMTINLSCRLSIILNNLDQSSHHSTEHDASKASRQHSKDDLAGRTQHSTTARHDG